MKETILAYSSPVSLEGEQLLETGPPSEQAILVSLFGWRAVLPATSHDSRRSSFSRSYTSVPSSPVSMSHASTPARDTLILSSSNKRDTLLCCTLCQRRIGLWTFLPETSIAGSISNGNTDPSTFTPPKTVRQRQFDLLREHRSYCPYAVRSTTIPTLPVSSPQLELSGSNNQLQSIQLHPDDTMEGWRAILTVVLRYDLGQKYTSDHKVSASKGESNREYEDAMELKGVIAGVKSRGVSYHCRIDKLFSSYYFRGRTC